MPVRIAILCDDSQLSDAWTRAINSEPSYDAIAVHDGAGLRVALRSTNPEFVVIDNAFPGALALCRELSHADGPRLLVGNVAEDEGGLEALTAGARGIIYTSAFPQEIVKALRMIANNQVWAPRHVVVAMWQRMRIEHEKRLAAEAVLAQRLSSREREVLRYAAAGLGNKEVASRLAISEATVKVHLTHIFQKLGLKGRGELAAAYHGILR